MIPEFQLLVYGARESSAESISTLIQSGVDWNKVLELARFNCVRPLLYRRLKSSCWDLVPRTVSKQLEAINAAIVKKNLFCAGELLALLGAFQQNGVRVATLKGPALAQSLYGDLCLREFADLDLIVHREDVCKAEDILSARGYRAQFPDQDYRSIFLRYQGQYAFRHSQTGLWVDLHWELSSKGVVFPLKADEIWASLGHVTIAERAVPTLSDNHLALFLAAHGAKEGWARLVWVSDYARLVQTYEKIDWGELLERAERSYCSRSFLLAILLASTLLAAPAPAQLVEKARESRALRALMRQSLLRMLGTASEGEIVQFFHSINTHDRLRHKISTITKFLTTRTVGDYNAIPLPKSLWHVYYLLRPFRLLKKAVNMLLGKAIEVARHFRTFDLGPFGGAGDPRPPHRPHGDGGER
jgi:hypothetical protein